MKLSLPRRGSAVVETVVFVVLLTGLLSAGSYFGQSKSASGGCGGGLISPASSSLGQ